MTQQRPRRLIVVGLKVVIGLAFLLAPLGAVMAQLAPGQRPAPAAATTLLVSSVFAAGTGGSAMTSSQYRMLGVLGEAGLPANQTTLSSQTYQLQPGFLAALPNSQSRTYLPALLRNYILYFLGPNEAEVNDSAAQANGPLQSGVDYHGYQNNQPADKDYFSFYLVNTGNITINLTNANGVGTKLALYYQTDLLHSIQYDDTAPFQIVLSGRPSGWYYIEVYDVGGFNNSTPYTLRVTYP